MLRRELPEMPFDKVFVTDEGNEELCQSTGYEACFGDQTKMMNWWNEYVDSNGSFHYGR